MAHSIQTNPSNPDYIDFVLDGYGTLTALKKICTVRLDPDDADQVIITFIIHLWPSHAPLPILREDVLQFFNEGRKGHLLKLDWNDVGSPSVTSAADLLLQINLILGTGAGSQIYIDQSPSGGAYGVISGLINGSNTSFVNSHGIYIASNVKVFLNGQLLSPGAGRLTLTNPATGIFDIASPAPKSGNYIVTEYTIS